jgi:hypothetical protein
LNVAKFNEAEQECNIAAPYFGRDTVNILAKESWGKILAPFFSPLLFNHLYFLILPMWLPAELEQIKLIFHKSFQK